MDTSSVLPGRCDDRRTVSPLVTRRDESCWSGISWPDGDQVCNTPTADPSLFLGRQRVAHPQVRLDRGESFLGKGLHHRIVTAVGIARE